METMIEEGRTLHNIVLVGERHIGKDLEGNDLYFGLDKDGNGRIYTDKWFKGSTGFWTRAGNPGYRASVFGPLSTPGKVVKFRKFYTTLTGAHRGLQRHALRLLCGVKLNPELNPEEQ